MRHKSLFLLAFWCSNFRHFNKSFSHSLSYILPYLKGKRLYLAIKKSKKGGEVDEKNESIRVFLLLYKKRICHLQR